MKHKIVTVKLYVKFYERGRKKESQDDLIMNIRAFLGHESSGYDPLFYRYDVVSIEDVEK